jgi:hypothetical protein
LLLPFWKRYFFHNVLFKIWHFICVYFISI